MFQPGEEGYHGARFMLEDGLLDPLPDAAFALHIMPNAPHGTIGSRAGTLLASADMLEIVGRRARRPRLDAARHARPGAGRLRDRAGAAGDGHAPLQRRPRRSS